jgi:hypothetical protein
MTVQRRLDVKAILVVRGKAKRVKARDADEPVTVAAQKME